MTFHVLYTSKSKNPTIETGSFAPRHSHLISVPSLGESPLVTPAPLYPR